MITQQHLQELENNGYTVVENVLTSQKCEQYINRFWDWLHNLNTGIDRNNPLTWKTMPDGGWPLNIRGIIKHYRVGQSQFVWDIRCEPNVIQVFKDLWNDDDLLVSFDAVNIMKPPSLGGPTKTKRTWYHTDQGSKKKGRHCIQGFVTLEDIEVNDGALMVIPKTHNYHEEFFQHFGIECKNDWFKLKPEELNWFLQKGEEPKKILAPKGSVVLWDSRLIHCNTKPNKEGNRFRYVVYTCMMPRKLCSEKMIQKRINAFENLRMTNHWANDLRLVEKNPQTYGVEMPEVNLQTNLPVLTEVGRKLVGY